MMCKTFGNACAGDNAGAGRRVIQCVMMLENYTEALRNGIQRMRFHFREKLSADFQTVGIVELHWRQFVQRQYASQVPQIKRGVVDDDTFRGQEQSAEFWPDADELGAVADIPVG